MEQLSNQIKIRRPDDWHLHLRDGATLSAVLPFTAKVFKRAIVMPNLQPPITSIKAASEYRQRISDSTPRGTDFEPLITAYLTDDFSSKELEKGYVENIFFAAKLYPANVTTNSSSGVTDLSKVDNIFSLMEDIGMPLLIHGEVTDKNIDIFDREAIFIEKYLKPLMHNHPKLRIVLEHITTIQAIDFVEKSGPNIAATITPHHLHINRNDMFRGGLRSDFYCLPVAKRENHRIALRNAATSGKSCFFLGTDSAPHPRYLKESSCSCAGIFNSPFAIESYAEVFDEEGALENLESFSSEFGASFYKLPLNIDSITLARKDHFVTKSYEFLDEHNNKESVVPFHAGEKLRWSVLQDTNF